MTEKVPNIQELIGSLRAEAPAQLQDAVTHLETQFTDLKSHPQALARWRSEYDMVAEVIMTMIMVTSAPEVLDRNLGKKLPSVYAVSDVVQAQNVFAKAAEANLKSPEAYASVVAFFAYAAMQVQRKMDIAQKLERDYGLKDDKARFKLSENTDDKVRLEYDGNVDAFFTELAEFKKAHPQEHDVEKLIHELYGHNRREKYRAQAAGQSTDPGLKM